MGDLAPGPRPGGSQAPEPALLRSRPVVALFVAEVVSTTGSQMTWLALPWFVFVTTGSATRMTLVVAAELAGLAAFALPGSRLLRRWGAWRAMVACDVARAPLLGLVPLLHWAGWLSLGVLVASTSPLRPARLSVRSVPGATIRTSSAASNRSA